jgi:hypothetical protein
LTWRTCTAHSLALCSASPETEGGREERRGEEGLQEKEGSTAVKK